MQDPTPGPKQGSPQWKKPLEEVNCTLAAQMAAWMRKRGKALRPKLSKEQRQQLHECFELMDADGSGAIDASELGAAFKLLGLEVSKGEIEGMLAEVDHDGSGEVEYPEFLEIMTTTLAALEARRMEEGTADSSVPFSLLATAYRRKRIMTGLISGDKEVVAQVVAMAEEAAQREAEARASTAGAAAEDNSRGSQGGRSTGGGSRSSQPGGRSSISGSTGGAAGGGGKRSSGGGAPPPALPRSLSMMRQKEREQLQQKQLHEEQEREQQQQQDPALLDQAVMEGCGAPPGLQRLLKRVATVNAARWAKGCVAVNLQDQLSPEEMEQLTELLRIKARQRIVALNASIKVRNGGTSSSCVSAATSRPGSAPLASPSAAAAAARDGDWGWGGGSLSGGSSGHSSSGEGCSRDVLGRPVRATTPVAQASRAGGGSGELHASSVPTSPKEGQQQQRQRAVKWQEGDEAAHHHQQQQQQQQQQQAAEEGVSGSRPGSPSRLGELSSAWDAAAAGQGSGEVPRQLLRGPGGRPCSPSALMLLAPLQVPQVQLPFTGGTPGSRGRMTPTSRPGTGCGWPRAASPPHGSRSASASPATAGGTGVGHPPAAAGQQREVSSRDVETLHQQATASSSSTVPAKEYADTADATHSRPTTQQRGRSKTAGAVRQAKVPVQCPTAAAAAAAAAGMGRQGGREVYSMHTHDMAEGWGHAAPGPTRSRSPSPPRSPFVPYHTPAAGAAAGRLTHHSAAAHSLGSGGIGTALVGGKPRQQLLADLPGVSYKGRSINLL